MFEEGKQKRIKLAIYNLKSWSVVALVLKMANHGYHGWRYLEKYRGFDRKFCGFETQFG